LPLILNVLEAASLLIRASVAFRAATLSPFINAVISLLSHCDPEIVYSALRVIDELVKSFFPKYLMLFAAVP
jgi:hypothetical protein